MLGSEEWRSSSVLVSGYSKIHFLIKLANPHSSNVGGWLWHKAGVVEVIGASFSMDHAVDSCVFGPFDVKGPKIFLTLNNSPSTWSYTATVVAYVVP